MIGVLRALVPRDWRRRRRQRRCSWRDTEGTPLWRWSGRGGRRTGATTTAAGRTLANETPLWTRSSTPRRGGGAPLWGWGTGGTKSVRPGVSAQPRLYAGCNASGVSTQPRLRTPGISAQPSLYAGCNASGVSAQPRLYAGCNASGVSAQPRLRTLGVMPRVYPHNRGCVRWVQRLGCIRATVAAYAGCNASGGPREYVGGGGPLAS
eukprot:1189938-Prorocentrum_minimum.AAC.1